MPRPTCVGRTRPPFAGGSGDRGRNPIAIDADNDRADPRNSPSDKSNKGAETCRRCSEAGFFVRLLGRAVRGRLHFRKGARVVVVARLGRESGARTGYHGAKVAGSLLATEAGYNDRPSDMKGTVQQCTCGMETRGAGRKRRWFGVPILLALVLASWEARRRAAKLLVGRKAGWRWRGACWGSRGAGTGAKLAARAASLRQRMACGGEDSFRDGNRRSTF